MNRMPDVEALFEFNGTRKTPAMDGYRPAHLITGKYLTTGIHHYYSSESVSPDGMAKGTITFLSPEVYPHCLWVGKKYAYKRANVLSGMQRLPIFSIHCCNWKFTNEPYQPHVYHEG